MFREAALAQIKPVEDLKELARPASALKADTLGEGLRQLRNRAGMTQMHVAQAAGTHQSYISALERGVVRCSDGLMLRISNALGAGEFEKKKLSELRENFLYKRTELGKLLTELRARKGVSVSELAGAAALDKRHIDAIEQGSRGCTVEKLERIADELKLEAEERELLVSFGHATGVPREVMGKWLRERRELVGITQRQLAVNMGVGIKYVSWLELGRQGIYEWEVDRIAEGLGLDDKDAAELSRFCIVQVPPGSELGRKVREFRERAMLTPSKLDRLAGLKSGSVTNIEVKLKNIPYERLMRIAGALDLSNDEGLELSNLRTVSIGPDPILGSMIRNARELNGISQGELARIIGASWSLLSYIEKGARSVSERHFQLIEDAVGPLQYGRELVFSAKRGA
ncbi:MAG: helix-turn-helix domain-containing protein [Candidatus Micrarchaeota archaeon]|nr:helix-turn-helix domain-containing protein [Candidatus Micrarchaeota archaeon]MDE1860030.1 helix-turn-helix domain-containing protein [Candidatus Micrarchaeota archaeon]